jgi:hypothetical protein
MQYMLLIYRTEDLHGQRSPEQLRAGMEAHRKLMEETSRRGVYIGAQPLKPTTTAKTVRLGSDLNTTFVTDGPFAETKEQLAGYYLLDCATMEEAIEYAKKIPQHCAAPGGAGGVEVRPIQEFAEIQQMLDTLVAEQSA